MKQYIWFSITLNDVSNIVKDKKKKKVVIKTMTSSLSVGEKIFVEVLTRKQF